MFAKLHLLPYSKIADAWEAFCCRPHQVSMDDLPPHVARLVQSAWNNGAEVGAALERERQEAERQR